MLLAGIAKPATGDAARFHPPAAALLAWRRKHARATPAPRYNSTRCHKQIFFFFFFAAVVHALLHLPQAHAPLVRHAGVLTRITCHHTLAASGDATWLPALDLVPPLRKSPDAMLLWFSP